MKSASKLQIINSYELKIYLNNSFIHFNIINFDKYFIIIKDKYLKIIIHLFILLQDSNKNG